MAYPDSRGLGGSLWWSLAYSNITSIGQVIDLSEPPFSHL